MDKQIQKLKNLIKQHLHQPKSELESILGKPNKSSNDCIWFYSRYHSGIFRDEIAFIFQEDEVVDICITEYLFFFIEFRNIFYYENKNPEYKVMRLF